MKFKNLEVLYFQYLIELEKDYGNEYTGSKSKI